MSKERLENMKSTIKLIKDYVEAETHHFETLALATELILNHGEWLIEQAERVQELEEKLIEAKDDYDYLSYHYGNETEQNKRYREAIKDIGNVWKLTNNNEEYIDAIHDIIKHLEESE